MESRESQTTVRCAKMQPPQPAVEGVINRKKHCQCHRYSRVTVIRLAAYSASSRALLAGIDLSVPALSLLEGQKRPVSDIELNALADILNVSVDWLLGREEK